MVAASLSYPRKRPQAQLTGYRHALLSRCEEKDSKDSVLPIFIMTYIRIDKNICLIEPQDSI